jgi:hypothetical protein
VFLRGLSAIGKSVLQDPDASSIGGEHPDLRHKRESGEFVCKLKLDNICRNFKIYL